MRQQHAYSVMLAHTGMLPDRWFPVNLVILDVQMRTTIQVQIAQTAHRGSMRLSALCSALHVSQDGWTMTSPRLHHVSFAPLENTTTIRRVLATVTCAPLEPSEMFEVGLP